MYIIVIKIRALQYSSYRRVNIIIYINTSIHSDTHILYIIYIIIRYDRFTFTGSSPTNFVRTSGRSAAIVYIYARHNRGSPHTRTQIHKNTTKYILYYYTYNIYIHINRYMFDPSQFVDRYSLINACPYYIMCSVPRPFVPIRGPLSTFYGGTRRSRT